MVSCAYRLQSVRHCSHDEACRQGLGSQQRKIALQLDVQVMSGLAETLFGEGGYSPETGGDY